MTKELPTHYAPVRKFDERGAALITLRQGEPLPVEFMAMFSIPDVSREIVRFAGGCKFFTPELLAKLRPYIEHSFADFNGFAFSGGTAQFYTAEEHEKSGGANEVATLKDDMITNAPGWLAKLYACMAMHTTPMTGATMAQNYYNGGVIVDSYGGARLDFRHCHINAVVEGDIMQGKKRSVGWNGDIDLYMALLLQLRKVGFKIMISVTNGGDLTRDEEMYKPALLDIPTIIQRGSLREADAFVAAFERGDFSLTGAETRANLVKKAQSTDPVDAAVAECERQMKLIDRKIVKVVDFGNAEELRAAAKYYGFFQPVQAPVV